MESIWLRMKMNKKGNNRLFIIKNKLQEYEIHLNSDIDKKFIPSNKTLIEKQTFLEFAIEFANDYCNENFVEYNYYIDKSCLDTWDNARATEKRRKQFWCRNNHYWEVGQIELIKYPEKSKCTTCGEKSVFENKVDETNGIFDKKGKDISGSIKIKPINLPIFICPRCKKKKIYHYCSCTSPLYEIPKNKLK